MGAPMARRLLAAGNNLQAWNRSAGKLQELLAAGGELCGTPAEAARGVEFLCLCLTDSIAVESVLFGQDGAMEGLSESAVIIDFSTIGREATLQLAVRSAERGVSWLDCPVSGGVVGAEAGTLSIFVGGETDVLERALPLLGACAARVTHMGPIGSGQATKLCNQLIVAANLLAIAEATHVGQALGIDVTRLPDALQGGFADSKPLQIFGGRMASSQDPGPRFGDLWTMLKDIGAIQLEARAAGGKVPLLEHVFTLYSEVISGGFGSEDMPGLMHLYRDDSLHSSESS